ncbi:MAG TPA: preprotein translocase subunit SecE [Thermomicrobiales bacterium]|nr:preprotein translocase subunit SecE [Thermomicrobiales bacterium]
MSSQQQSTGYKRRSSGKRTRRPAQATAETGSAAAVGTVEAVDAVDAPAPPRQPARATSQKAEPGRASSKTPEPAWYDRFVNLDRFEGLRRFIRESWSEIQKVIWPDRETTRNLTLVVIAVSIVLGILLGGIDYVLFQLFEALP